MSGASMGQSFVSTTTTTTDIDAVVTPIQVKRVLETPELVKKILTYLYDPIELSYDPMELSRINSAFKVPKEIFVNKTFTSAVGQLLSETERNKFEIELKNFLINFLKFKSLGNTYPKLQVNVLNNITLPSDLRLYYIEYFLIKQNEITEKSLKFLSFASNIPLLAPIALAVFFKKLHALNNIKECDFIYEYLTDVYVKSKNARLRSYAFQTLIKIIDNLKDNQRNKVYSEIISLIRGFDRGESDAYSDAFWTVCVNSAEKIILNIELEQQRCIANVFEHYFDVIDENNNLSIAILTLLLRIFKNLNDQQQKKYIEKIFDIILNLDDSIANGNVRYRDFLIEYWFPAALSLSVDYSKFEFLSVFLHKYCSKNFRLSLGFKIGFYTDRLMCNIHKEYPSQDLFNKIVRNIEEKGWDTNDFYILMNIYNSSQNNLGEKIIDKIFNVARDYFIKSKRLPPIERMLKLLDSKQVAELFEIECKLIIDDMDLILRIYDINVLFKFLEPVQKEQALDMLLNKVVSVSLTPFKYHDVMKLMLNFIDWINNCQDRNKLNYLVSKIKAMLLGDRCVMLGALTLPAYISELSEQDQVLAIDKIIKLSKSSMSDDRNMIYMETFQILVKDKVCEEAKNNLFDALLKYCFNKWRFSDLIVNNFCKLNKAQKMQFLHELYKPCGTRTKIENLAALMKIVNKISLDIVEESRLLSVVLEACSSQVVSIARAGLLVVTKIFDRLNDEQHVEVVNLLLANCNDSKHEIMDCLVSVYDAVNPQFQKEIVNKFKEILEGIIRNDDFNLFSRIANIFPKLKDENQRELFDIIMRKINRSGNANSIIESSLIYCGSYIKGSANTSGTKCFPVAKLVQYCKEFEPFNTSLKFSKNVDASSLDSNVSDNIRIINSRPLDLLEDIRPTKKPKLTN